MTLVAVVCFLITGMRARIGVHVLSAQNTTDLFLQNSCVIIMAPGTLPGIVLGHSDPSVGAVAAFAGAVARRSCRAGRWCH